MQETTALYTDHYELTMIDAALQAGTANRDAIFEMFTRRLCGGRRYAVVAGTGRLLRAIKNFRFADSELEFLKRQRIVSDTALDWLANYRFSGDIWGYPEGEVFFPGSPIMTVHASFAEGVILETLALSIMNYDSAVATAASRMVHAAKGKPLAEMGSRRTGEASAVAAARAAYIAGFNATSNLQAGHRYGIPTMGTAAHSFTLLHDSERAAFAAQIAAFGPGTTLLIDTYNIQEGVRNAIEVAGPELGAVRIDSGDLPVTVAEVRRLLDELGAHKTKITVTNDLDEYTVAALAATAVDSFGVGTSVVVGSGSPSMGLVYKLVARADDNGKWVPVAKRSSGKVSLGGVKNVRRLFNADGQAVAEHIAVVDAPAHLELSLASAQAAAPLTATDPADADIRQSRNVLTPLMQQGEAASYFADNAGIARARELHACRLQELPPLAMSLTRGDPAIPSCYS